MRFPFCCLTAFALAASLATAASVASAAEPSLPRLRVDWTKISDAFGSAGVALFHPLESARPRPHTESGFAPWQRRWLGFTPDISLVARDWGGAQLLVGELSVTDTVRISRSIRMVVTRVRLSEGRLAPFAQIGMGQWRVDTDLMPAMRRSTELASQLGVGAELRVVRDWRVALECDQTVLYRDPGQVSGPRLWTMFAAMRGTF